MGAELEKAKESLDKAEKRQEIMKKANAIIRTGKDVTNKLVEIGLTEAQALKVQEKDFAGRIGFPSYELTNNNATIKRLKDRVNLLESKEQASKAGEETYKFDGGVVEVNYADDRVQILYDAIPSAEERTKLKGSGWKWSPKNSAWQRKITPQAISSAKYLTGATGAAPVQEQTGPIDTDDLLKKRKFSYVTVSLYGALPEEYKGSKSFEFVYFDVITANIVEAVKTYFKENLPDLPSEKVKVSVYAKVYVKESQRLVDQNRFLPNDAPAKIVLGPGYQQIKDFFTNKPEPEPTPEPEPEPINDQEPEPTNEPKQSDQPEYEPQSRMWRQGSTVDTKEKYISWKQQQIWDSTNDMIVRQNADRLPDETIVNYQDVVDATSAIMKSGRESDKRVANAWAEQMILAVQWFDPEFKDWKNYDQSEKDRLLSDYEQFGIKIPEKIREKITAGEGPEFEPVLRFPELPYNHPLNILDLKSPQYKQSLDEYNNKKFLKEHIVIGKIPNHYEKDLSDNKILERYPKLSKSEIVSVYNQVETILAKDDYTAEDKYILEKYEGLGSQTSTGIIDKGLLHQFYTPYIIGKKMWELGYIYGVPKENAIVVEPSMGTGRFFKFAPAGSTLIGFYPDKKNVEIAKILYPNATIYQQEFETAFLEAPRYNRMAKKSWLPEADLCIGNPPYGDYMGYYKSYMPSAFKRFEFLFIYLGLKTLKSGGLLIFIVSQNFMNNGAMYNGMKAKILEIGTFVDSIRLPNGIFSSTDVGTDIVIFRKK